MAARGHPRSRARCARAYGRAVLAGCSRTWKRVDCRTSMKAGRSRCAGRMLDGGGGKSRCHLLRRRSRVGPSGLGHDPVDCQARQELARPLLECSRHTRPHLGGRDVQWSGDGGDHHGVTSHGDKTKHVTGPHQTGSHHDGGAWRRPAGWRPVPAGGSAPRGARPGAVHRVRAEALGLVEAHQPARPPRRLNAWRVRRESHPGAAQCGPDQRPAGPGHV
jgi:hypothetical protein